MKRKHDTQADIMAKLEKSIEKLLAATERLAGAADHGRRQIDRFAQLIAHAEDILRRSTSRGISLENDDRYDKCQPLNLSPDGEQDDDQDEYFVNYGFGHFVEFSSYEELKKFQKMPPISGDDIESCDFDEVIQQLLSDNGETQS